MTYNFEIESFPSNHAGYNVPAFTEGELSVFVDGEKLFFQEDGIHLVEFAVVLAKWLSKMSYGNPDLFYASMDFEEEPIFALNFDKGKMICRPVSVWNYDFEHVETSIENAERAPREYIDSLIHQVKHRYGAPLDLIVERIVNQE